MAERPVRWWASLTIEEVREVAANDPVVILPLAATEQHGPHLPLSTDLDIGLGLLASAFERLAPDSPALALPPQAVGCSREHTRFPGTLSLDSETLVQVIVAHGRALARAGVRRLVLANSHGGNRYAIDDAGLRLRDECEMLVVKAFWGRFPLPEELGLPAEELRDGLHAGAVETAMMMHLHPDRVRLGQIQRTDTIARALEAKDLRIAPEGAAAFSWMAGDLHPSGVAGDATLATPALGAALVGHFGGVLATIIQDARRFPLERLG